MPSARLLLAAAGVLCAAQAEVVKDSYIVMMATDASDAAFDAVHRRCDAAYRLRREALVQARPEVLHRSVEKLSIGSRSGATGHHPFRATRCYCSGDEAAEIQQMEGVAVVEAEVIEHMDEAGDMCPSEQGGVRDEDVGWNQMRLTSPDHNLLPFRYNPEWGSGVDAYVLDTGCRCSHEDFEGRCVQARTYFSYWDYSTGEYKQVEQHGDGHGHGTHVAGIIGGKKWGVAKNVTLKCVKVMSDSGGASRADTIDALDWIAGQVAATGRPSVINRSIGGQHSEVLNQAVAAVVALNIQMFNSAGNLGRECDSCERSPGSQPTSVTVGSFTTFSSSDQISWFSCRGPCVDIFGPGNRVTSVGYVNDYGSRSTTGTSQAAPAAAGVAAVYLTYNPQATSADVKRWLIDNSQKIDLQVPADGVQGSPNRVLHIPCTVGPTPSPLPLPSTPLPMTTTTTTTTTTETPVPTEARCASTAVLQEASGVLRFPADGGRYANNVEMCWKVACSSSAGLTVVFDSFALERRFDFLFVSAAGEERALTGGSLPEPLVVQGDVGLAFTSDGSRTDEGFVLRWGCGVPPPPAGSLTTTAAPPLPPTTTTTTAEPADTSLPPATTAAPSSKACEEGVLLETFQGMEGAVAVAPSEISGSACWVVACSGVLLVDFTRLDVRSGDMLHLRSSTSEQAYSGAALPQRTEVQGPVALELIAASASSFGVEWRCVPVA